MELSFFTLILILFSITVANKTLTGKKTTAKKYPKFPNFYNVSNATVLTKSGEPLLLYCYVRGSPKPIMKWYHSEHDPFQTSCPFVIPEKDKERIVYQNNSQEIFFHQTLGEDNGYYTCNGSNRHGSTAFIYKLTVLNH